MTLPTHYLITPSPEDEAAFIEGVEKSLQAGTRLMQLKAKGYSEEAYASWPSGSLRWPQLHCKVLLTGEASLVEQWVPMACISIARRLSSANKDH
ncbi:hypothetical protein [Candidatus Reidiella endopervernicosa]|uniref:Uncharacterized protein n=1 Tax=Candidatus Reidiella endopervernicosa TaxID=2738883 RepID=A0A6N0HT09_9GAMM|nr:hypothetical protein [Candidatus Reidiella endopervernicosa]QKQ25513.1 hypothetical protein HUE57_03770 [Candidatus Reidiella endopervernicosa]